MNTIEQAREVSSRIWLAGYVDESATIDALIAELVALKSQEPETYYRHFDGGTQDYSSESTVPLYLAAGAQERKPLSEFERMQIIGNEFPLPLVEPLIIQKIDSVCIAIEAKIKEQP